ncbi:Hypothetical_protein [Hexamita inflata]|uniref:Hypothetical_protein n=1 Tax=Hexamita inflata TaxID=28002 RepID=A0AA86UVC0_9EUKA|nr:Hypothetical protein HINF_LOCUS38283 [Hexamita inflata]
MCNNSLYKKRNLEKLDMNKFAPLTDLGEDNDKSEKEPIEKFLFQQNKWNNSHASQSDNNIFTSQMGENRRRKSNHQIAITSARQLDRQNKFASLNSEDSSSNSGNFSHYQEQQHRKEQNIPRTEHRKLYNRRLIPLGQIKLLATIINSNKQIAYLTRKLMQLTIMLKDRLTVHLLIYKTKLMHQVIELQIAMHIFKMDTVAQIIEMQDKEYVQVELVHHGQLYMEDVEICIYILVFHILIHHIYKSIIYSNQQHPYILVSISSFADDIKAVDTCFDSVSACLSGNFISQILPTPYPALAEHSMYLWNPSIWTLLCTWSTLIRVRYRTCYQ